MSLFLSPQTALWVALITFCISACVASFLIRQRLSQQRERLRSEHERWALVLAANHDGIFEADLRTGQMFYSPGWLTMLGYPPGELPPNDQTWSEQIHPDDRERVNRTLAEYLSRQAPKYDTEYRMQHRDGHWCWVHARATAVWDEDGNAVRLVGSTADITRRKNAEFELKASEERLRTFMEHNPAATFIKDQDGRLLYTNRSFNEVFQTEPEASLGKLDAEIWPEVFANRVRANDLEVFASSAPREVLENLPLPDGSVRQFRVTKFPFRDSSDRRVLGGIAFDVTDGLNAEAALRDSEAKYRELFERNPLPGWIYNTQNFKIVDVNYAAIAHYGWSRSEFLSLTMHDIRMRHEFDWLELDLRTRSGPGERSGPWRHRRKDGSTIRVELAGLDLESVWAPMRVVFINDITARTETEAVKLTHDRLENLVEQRTAELRESEMRWRGLVEASPQMIWAASPEGLTSYLSPRVIEYTGLPQSELTGSQWFDILHPSDRTRTASAWHSCIQSGKPYEVEFRMRSKEGEYRWFKTIGLPISNAEGQVMRWIGTCTDIEDQKKSEEVLEAAVARRTVELADARDRAEAATRAKSQFLAAMSHEIRTPMNGVIGMASLMFDTDLTSKQRCYMDTIRSSGEALLTVINDILDLSKIEAGRLELERTRFDLSTLIDEAIELVESQAAAKNLKLVCTRDESIPLDLMGDPVRLRQVLLNLLSNAVKFTTDGSVSLSITREATQNQLAILRFAIKDTGIGLTTKQQEGLFQAFQQGEISTARRFGGTGLGLAISKSLVEMMGGSIGVRSVIGEGSTFWFNVCLESIPVFEQVDCFKSKHVAFVSNQPVFAKSICSYLEGVGVRVSTYPHIPPPEHSRFDLLLVDSAALASYPDTARLLRDMPMRIVILGAKADFKSPVTESGRISAYVEKPVRRLPLLRIIQSIFDGTARSSPVVSHNGSASHIKRAHVLLAEDNKVNQLVAKLLLEKLNCRVEIVENGVEACTAVQRQTFDLVLMDCQMPTMSGFEATQRIRNLETSGRRTPIVALTAGVLKEERDRCYELGMDDFLSKPISAKELANALERWLPVHQEALHNEPPIIES